ncbi:MAG TPA: SMI1/KNR4 family protein [Puia sp.]|nr:SMI1/KNR4 family protein [Puia sp.]
MATEFEKMLSKLEKNEAPTNQLVQSLMLKINFQIDKDYLEFIRTYDGAEGTISEGSYLLLWRIKDLIELNPYYKDDDFSTKVFIIGSNGGGTAYGIKKDDDSFFKSTFLELADELEYCGKDFKEFLLHIA